MGDPSDEANLVRFRAGDRVAGRFTIVKPLHRPDTFHARDGKHHVAIELAPKSTESLIARAGALEHPNICRVLELVDEAPHHIIVMELVEGVTIADRLMIGAFDPAQACALLEQLLAALACGHATGIAHGHVSAANVMIDQSGRLKLLDFGITRRRATPRGDVRAVGGLAHSMLTGDTGPLRLMAVPVGYRAWVRRCTTAILSFADADAAAAALRKLPASEPRVNISMVLASGAIATVAIAVLLVWAARATDPIGDTVAATPLKPAPVESVPLPAYTQRPPLPAGAVEQISAIASDAAVAAAATGTTGGGTRGTISQVRFPAEAAWLDHAAVLVLEKVFAQLAREPQLHVELEGHASSEGDETDLEKNQRLALWRATAVRDFLIKRGIDEKRIEIRAHGDARPAAPNDTPTGRSQNRRVEIRARTR